MTKPRLLWVSHLVPYPPKGGVLQRSFNLIKYLSKDFDIYLFAFNQSAFLKSSFTESISPLDDAKTGLAPYIKELRVVDIPSERVPLGKYILAFRSLFSSRPYTINWLHSRIAESQLSKMYEIVKPDVVHFDTISLAPYLKCCRGTPTVLNHHNVESQMMCERSINEGNVAKRLYYRLEGRKLRSYEHRVLSKFDLNITCSDQDSSLLATEHPGVNCLTVPNGVDTEYFKPEKSEYEDFSLIFAGGLGWYPNLDAMNYFVDEIWPLLKMKMPNATMHLIGRNPTNKFLSLAKQDPDFLVHGFVDDVRPYLKRADVYVCPIREGGGTKLKILDALAMGCPVVSHPFATVGIDVEQGVTVEHASSPEEFYLKIERIFSDRDLRKRLSVNGPKLVSEKYSFESIAKRYSLNLKTLMRDDNE